MVAVRRSWARVDRILGVATTPKRFGRLRPRYTFLLNPHAFCRLSRCPDCARLTHARKFPLAILVEIDPLGLMVLVEQQA